MSDTITILLYSLGCAALACCVQLGLLALARLPRCPRALRTVLTFFLLLPAAGLLIAAAASLLSKPSGFLDLRLLAAMLFAAGAVLILVGWAAAFAVWKLVRRSS